VLERKSWFEIFMPLCYIRNRLSAYSPWAKRCYIWTITVNRLAGRQAQQWRQ
jgi:hypothetical protein